MVKISVITPVYNDENHLEECLDSIINQSLKDIEVICIDDGSTDNSVNILNNYSTKYDFIKIYSQKNEGPGNARNNALKKASGDYIVYLDSDDIFIDKNALEIMYDAAIKFNTNVVSANLKVIIENGDLVKSYNLPRFEHEGFISIQDYGIPWSFYKNIFNKSFLIENNILFPDLKRGEDPVFLAEIFSLIDEIYTVPIDLYGYRDELDNGLEKIDYHQKVYDYVKHFKLVFDFLNNSKYYLTTRRYEEKLLEFINKRADIADDIKNVIFDVFKNNKDILNKCYPKISVVIPVYNVEEFLYESMGSLLNQSMKETEFICVNDGSKDNSLFILEEFSLKDLRVRVIDKVNGGCGSARNRALDESRGEYVYFFDPDDYILPNALEELYKNALSNNSDLVMFKIAWFMDGEPVDYSKPLFNFDEIFEDVDFNNFTFTYHDIKRHVMNSGFAPWSKLYKKEFLDEYDDFRFDLGVAFDDVPFHVKSLLRAKKISFAPNYYYHYRYANPNSVNNTSSNGVDIMKIINLVEEFIKSEDYFEEFEKEFYEFKVNQITLYMISSHSDEYFNLAKRNLLELNPDDIKEIPWYLLLRYEWTVTSYSFREYELKKQLYELERDYKRLIIKRKPLKDKNNKLKKKLIKSNKYNKRILNSTSWKVTKPLRTMKNSFN